MGFSVSVKERRLILVLIVVIWCFITMGGVGVCQVMIHSKTTDP